ncbi:MULTISPECIES: MerR family transcriptional regulator [Cellvibrio]|nr:MerR family transcriptional regulator [Cellvibrio fibrivorans]
MRVAQLARELAISADTIRYYTLIGLIKPKRNPANNYKEYREEERRRLQFILSARKLGFTLNDIKEIIREASKGKMACPLVRQILEKRLQETEQSFNQQSALRKHMKKAMKDWKNKPNQEPNGHEICHLIEGFSFANE